MPDVKYKNKTENTDTIQIQMPAAGCEEDGGTNQWPTWIQEQDAQLQVGQADVGHLSVSFNQTLIKNKLLMKILVIISYEMSWFPDHQPLEKDYNSSSSNQHWPWLVCLMAPLHLV